MDYSLHDCELSDECEPLFPIQYADKEPPIQTQECWRHQSDRRTCVMRVELFLTQSQW